jgi:acetyltransferase-like isoleucine patch superfamily enzyme
MSTAARSARNGILNLREALVRGVAWRDALARSHRALARRALSQRAVHWAWQAAQRAGAVTAGSPAGDRFAAFGSGSVLAFPPGAIFGEAWIEIGADTVIGKHVSACAGTVPGQDLGPVPLLRIGDRCVIGRGTHIVAHESIVIGDDVFTGPYVYITDQNHSYADPDAPIGRQWPANAPVSIGAGSWLGAGAIILPGSVIGRNVVVGAGSVVRGRVPDRCVVAGVPAKIIRAYVAGDGWLPMRADAHDREPPADPGPLAGTGPLDDPGTLGGTGPLADPEGVEGVPEPPHPVF